MQPRPFNPMPDSLDDTIPGAQDVLGSAGQPIGPQGIMGELPPENPNAQRRSEIDQILAGKLTEQMINKEILDEKIRQDLDSAKKNKDLKAATTPRDLLKTLVALGDYKEDVEIYEHKWTIRALNQGDFVLAFNDIKDDNESPTGRLAALTISQIAYSIEACDGVPIYLWFPDLVKKEDYASTEEFKIAARKIFRRYLERMPSGIINQFDKAYSEIEKKRNEALNELKKS